MNSINIIKSKDLMLLLDCSYQTALRKYNLMRDTLKKKSHQPVTVEEAASYFDLNIDEMKTTLSSNNHNKNA